MLSIQGKEAKENGEVNVRKKSQLQITRLLLIKIFLICPAEQNKSLSCRSDVSFGKFVTKTAEAALSALAVLRSSRESLG